MKIDQNIQFNSDNKLIHFLNIENLSAEHIYEILELAEKVKTKSLEGKTIASLFFSGPSAFVNSTTSKTHFNTYIKLSPRMSD